MDSPVLGWPSRLLATDLTQRWARRAGPLAALLLALAYGAWLGWAGLWHAPGLQDNDFPLLMWLVKHASWSDPSPLAVGHYGPLQLLLVWWSHPLFGSVLTAAKVLNTFGTVLAAAALYGMTRRDHGEGPAILAMIAFGLSEAALKTGQSEFADALAAGVFLAGLYCWWGSQERRGLLAGVLLGAAGLMRLHYVFFSIGTAVLAGLLALALPDPGRSRRESLRPAAWLLLGTVLGNLPGFLLNLYVHGQLGSPVASSFVGQVLYGMDQFDLLSSYNRRPLGQILRETPGDLWRLMYRRIRENPLLWGIPLAACAVAAVRCRAWPAVLLRHVLLMGGLSLAYFLGFVTLSWTLTPRLLLPLMAFNCWLAVAATAGLVWSKFRFSRLLYAAVFCAAMVQLWPGVEKRLVATWRRSNDLWLTSSRLVKALRTHGMQDAREAFVFDWNRFVVDDPELQPFYNFGFWNLLVPRYREERPVPTPHLHDLPRLGAFLQEQQVRFLVLPQDLRRMRRFPKLQQLVRGKAQLPGYRREKKLRRDILFLREP